MSAYVFMLFIKVVLHFQIEILFIANDQFKFNDFRIGYRSYITIIKELSGNERSE